ncbi:MAG TPA: hypothetical protein VGI87_04780 [Solirubrobacteraceae bacterium]|jgi:hypothetical protein
MRRRLGLSLLPLLALVALAGCGGGSSSPVAAPAIGAARQFELAGFQPTGQITPGKPTTVAFTIQQPNGKALTRYKTGSGPHTGVHLIIVRDDLAYIIHQHPPVGANGRLTQTVTFPAPGTYRVLVDAYPDLPGGQPNFQLYKSIVVKGAYHPKPLPAFKADQVIDGYHVDMQGKPSLHSVQAQFLHVDVTDPGGKRVKFVPWFGALAHAIFFHQGSLDYFHTHICAPNAPNCGSLPGVPATRISGTSTAPGKLTVGVLLPVSGTWELFLQMKLNGKIVTVPYTLHVA